MNASGGSAKRRNRIFRQGVFMVLLYIFEQKRKQRAVYRLI